MPDGSRNEHVALSIEHPAPDAISRMRYNDLDTPIQSYVDNITDQIAVLVRKYDLKDPQEFIQNMKDEKLSVEDVKRFTLLMGRLSSAMMENKIPQEDKEYIQDKSLLEALSFQDAFYRSHNLSTLADMLPTPEMLAQLPKESLERIAEARKEGFDRMLIVPSIEQLKNHRESLIQHMATDSSDRLTGTNQYTFPNVDSDARNSTNINRPISKPYILLYQSSPVPKETKGLTFPQARDYFKTKNWNGLIFDEYLILQRIQSEENQNHLFDMCVENPSSSNGTWLLDSHTPFGVVAAGWYPITPSVDIHWRDVSESRPYLGARPAIVVSI